MKGLLLATVIFSTAACELDLRARTSRQKSPPGIFGKQTSWRREKQVSSDTNRFENYVDSDTDDFESSEAVTKRFNLPSILKIRAHPKLKNDVDTLLYHYPHRINPGYPSYHVENPSILLSLSFEEPNKKKERFTACNTDECYYHQQGWQLQAPFYVEEPTWIEIGNDYRDKLTRHLEAIDPFVLSRGKKIHKLKNTAVNLASGEVPLENENFHDVGNNLHLKSLMKSGGDFGVFKRKDSTNDGDNYRNSDYEDNDEMQENLKKKMYRGKSERWSEERFADDSSIERLRRSTSVFDNTKETQRNEHRGNNSNSSRIEKEFPEGKHEKIKNQGFVNEVKNQSNDSIALESILKINHTKNKTENSIIRNRGKRSLLANDDTMIDKAIEGGTNQWYERVLKLGSSSTYPQPRDSRSILLNMLDEPYFISREKKADSLVKNNRFLDPDLLESEAEVDAWIDRRSLQEILGKLMENLKCNSKECPDNFDRSTKRSSLWDGQGLLDNWMIKSDPFYIARGKRLSTDHTLI